MKQTCKYCKSEIDADCLVCPVCRQWLNIFSIKKENPLFKIALVAVMLMFCFGILPKIIFSKYFNTTFNLKQFQSSEVHHLKIVSHQVKKMNDRLIVIGELKNEGQDTFSSLVVEVSFYDQNNGLLDVETGYISGITKPGELRPFKIERCCEKDGLSINILEYDHYNLKIVNGFF